jgi:hypothetical protein
MADRRICDGIGFAQIKPDLRCASMPDRRDHSSTERRQCARSPRRTVSLSVTAWLGADMLGSRTLLRPGDRERTGGLRRDVPGA